VLVLKLYRRRLFFPLASCCCHLLHQLVHVILANVYIDKNKTSAIAEMGDRGHNRHGPKRWGATVPISRGGGELGLRLTECGLGRGLLTYQVASSYIQPYDYSRHGPKIGWGLCLFFWGELGAHLTQSRLDRGLPPYQVAS